MVTSTSDRSNHQVFDADRFTITLTRKAELSAVPSSGCIK